MRISAPAGATPMTTALAPAAVAGLKRLAHDIDIARAVERVVGAPAGQVDEIGDEIVARLARVDEMRHAEALAPGFTLGVEVDADDHVGADEPQPLHDVEPDAAEAEHDGVRPPPPPAPC